MHGILFVVGLIGFGVVAGERLTRQSADPHFVYQAEAWLRGELAVNSLPPGTDDIAIVETVALRDGRQVRGRRMHTRPVFATTRGERIAITDIRRTIATSQYVAFPPFPAALLIPQVLLSGARANDVLLTIVLAALALPLLFAVLRRLVKLEISQRTRNEDIWLTLAFGFGSVFYFVSVQGRVWFTAHVVGVLLCLSYIFCAVRAKHPIKAGIFLGLAAVTRTPMAFLFPLFLIEAWRTHEGLQNPRGIARAWLRFAAPIAVIAILAMAYNYARFEQVGEFGHRYLAVRQQKQIETFGLFDFQYLVPNLRAALTLLPQWSAPSPYVSVSGHGLAIWVTTPLLLLVCIPKRRGPFHLTVWFTCLCVALPTLFYQNTGWFQFGYRFSLDYLALLFVLLAIGGRPLNTRLARMLIILGIVVNLFGAVTFDRYSAYYRTDVHTYRQLSH